MYNLSIGLTYENFLKLDTKYRYDFLTIKAEYDYESDPLGSSIFVFRTVKESYLLKKESIDNILIDVVNYNNINGLDCAIHGDCHFHILEFNDFDLNKNIILKDNLYLTVVKNDFSKHIYAVTKNQKVMKFKNQSEITENRVFTIDEMKHFLFTINNSDVINCNKIELAKIFYLQAEHIWYNNRHYNYNNIYNLDLNKNSNNKIEATTPWKDVKKTIQCNYETWGLKSKDAFKSLLNTQRQLDYKILD